MMNRVLPVNLIASSATANAYGSPPSTIMAEKTETVQHCLRILRIRCPRQEEVVHTHPGFTSVRVDPWSVRVIHCRASHTVIAPRPKWEMRELVCINSSLLTFADSALCLGLRVSRLSPNCIGVASGSGTEIGGASTANQPCCSGIRAQRCSVRVFRRRAWLQLCPSWVLHT